MREPEEILKTISITYNWKDLDFIHLAFKYGSKYDNFNWLRDILINEYDVNIPMKNYDTGYSISKEIYKLVCSLNIENILNFTFYCFSLISNKTMDRKVNGKVRKKNSRLLKQIISREGKYKHLHQLKHLFIEQGRIQNNFMFGNYKFLLKTSKRN